MHNAHDENVPVKERLQTLHTQVVSLARLYLDGAVFVNEPWLT